MKKKTFVCVLLVIMIICCFAGCGDSSSSSSSGGNTVLSDEDFIKNLGSGLEARWDLASSIDTTEMSVSEIQEYDQQCLDCELNAIGDLDNYEFIDSNLEAIAESYMKGLSLQEEGIQYQGTNSYSEQEETWTLGYYYRTVAMTEMYNDYGLTFGSKYQSNIDDFVAQGSVAQKTVALHEFAEELANSIEYEFDEENSTVYTQYYKAVIENTTEYDIDSIAINVNFLDEDGIIVFQTSDYLNNVGSGEKIQSSIGNYSDEEFESMEVSITIYDY